MISTSFKRRVVVLQGRRDENMLEGVISFDAMGGKVLEYLSLRVIGKEAFQVDMPTSEEYGPNRRTEIILDKSRDLTPLLGGAGTVLPIECVGVPFREAIPHELPQSARVGARFQVRYTMCVTLKLQDEAVKQAEERFLVIKAPAAFRPHGWDAPVAAEADTRLGLFGRATLRVEAPARTLSADTRGRGIPVRCTVRNASRAAIHSVKLSLHRRITFGAGRATRVQEAQLAKQAFPCMVRAGEEFDGEFSFEPPRALLAGVIPFPEDCANLELLSRNVLRAAAWSSMPPRDDASGPLGLWTKLFTVEFELRMMASMRMARNPTVFVPVMLEQTWTGDIPGMASRGGTPRTPGALRPSTSLSLLQPTCPADAHAHADPDAPSESSSSSLPEVELQERLDEDDKDSVTFIPAYAPLPGSRASGEFDW